MSTGIARRQSLAEIIRRLLAHNAHLSWKISIILLLLQKLQNCPTILLNQPSFNITILYNYAYRV